MTDESISIDTGTNELLCSIRDRVAVITLNRTEARHSLSDHLTPAFPVIGETNLLKAAEQRSDLERLNWVRTAVRNASDTRH